MSRLKVYLAGPISIGNKRRNVQLAIDTGAELLRRGFNIYVPHLDFFIAEWNNDIAAWTLEQFLEIDLPLLELCDALLRLPGESRGADLEVEHAGRMGIPVFTTIDALVQGLRKETT